MQDGRLFINGEWMESGESFDIINPADGIAVAKAYAAGNELVDRAIAAASVAFAEWSQTPARKRAKILLNISVLLLEKKNEIGAILSEEQGKPLMEAVGEVIYSADFFVWFAEECKRLNSQLVPPSKSGHEIRVESVPVGVVAAITPWNFPAGMMARKVAPALAAGCTIVVKPASQTPLTAVKFFEVFQEAGLPQGVANLVMGSGKAIGDQFLQDKRIRKVSFTGSTEVGASIMQMAAKHITNISLELGGHAPFIILDDADIDKTVKDLTAIKLRNAGQTCISPNRIYVQEQIYDRFAEKLTERVARMKIGRYNEEKVAVGPLIDEKAIAHVQAQVDDAVSKGALMLHGGKRCDELHLRNGNFYVPTILSKVTPDMRVYEEETFGPIFPLIPFANDEEVIRMANDNQYGLAAYVYSENFKRSRLIADQLEYGTVSVNDISASDHAQAPVGGMKRSGIGREGGREGILEFMETRYVLTNYN